MIEYSKIYEATKESLKRNDLYGKDRYIFHLLSNLYTHPKDKREMTEVLSIAQCQILFNYVEKDKIFGSLIGGLVGGSVKDSFVEPPKDEKVVDYILNDKGILINKVIYVTILRSQKIDSLNLSETGDFLGKCYEKTQNNDFMVYAYFSTLLACLLRGSLPGRALYKAEGTVENNFKNNTYAKKFLKLMDKICELDGNEANDEKVLKIVNDNNSLPYALALSVYTCLKFVEDEKGTRLAKEFSLKHSENAGKMAISLIGAILGKKVMLEDGLDIGNKEEELSELAEKLYLHKLDTED